MDVQELVRAARTARLSIDEIGRGMHKSYKNAADLIADAELLLEHRPERALSLAVLAIEEIAKVVLLMNAAVRARRSTISWKDIQEKLDLRSHRHKQAVFAAYGRVILDKMASIAGKDMSYKQEVPSGIGPMLDYMKQLGFYVDVVNGQFISPAEFGSHNREWPEWLISAAKERLKRFEPLHETEDKSIEAAHTTSEIISIFLEAIDEKEFQEKFREFIERKSNSAFS